MMVRTVFIFTLAVALAGCGMLVDSFTLDDGSTHEGDISLVNGAIDIGRDCTVSGEISSVNGGVSIGDDSAVGEISNVNGSIAVGSGVSVGGDVDSVNGRVVIGENARVSGGVETVNGRIEINGGSVIDGQVSSVNGLIELRGAEASSLETVNGSIELSAGTRITGALTVHKPGGMGFSVSSPPRIVIGDQVEVAGPLTFEHEVELYVHETASVGTIEGAEPVSFSGESP